MPGDRDSRAGAASDAVSEAGEQRRKDGERRQHRGQDGEGGGDRQAAEQADPEHELAEQREDHGHAGEQHGSARGVHRAGDGGVDGIALLAVLPEASDDEQRVVDPHTEADHGGQLRGEVGDLDEVGAQAGAGST